MAAVVALAGLWALSALTPGSCFGRPSQPAPQRRRHHRHLRRLSSQPTPARTTISLRAPSPKAPSASAATTAPAPTTTSPPSTQTSPSPPMTPPPAASTPTRPRRHPPTRAARSTSSRGVLNRHAECGDCHNPHTVNDAATAESGSGWTASGALTGASGVAASAPLAWKNPIGYEYELCLKCHIRLHPAALLHQGVLQEDRQGGRVRPGQAPPTTRLRRRRQEHHRRH